MNTASRIVCLPIGRTWEASVRHRFDQLTSVWPQKILLDPAFEEPTVLDRLEKAVSFRPDLLLLAALHGASARPLVLAACRSHLPVAVWCHNDRHSLASSALAAEALRQLDLPCALIHEKSDQSLADAVGASAALRKLREARIGKIGATHFNLIGADINPLVLQKRFGAWVVPFSVSHLKTRARQIDSRRISDEIGRLNLRYKITVEKAVLKKALALHLALRDIAQEHRLDAIAVDCWNEILPEFGISPCLAFTDNSYRLACEGDLVLATTLLAGEAISGKPGYVGDLYSFSEKTGNAVLMHCAGCAALHQGPGRMAIARQDPPGPAGTKGDVVACRPVLPKGAGTVVLLHGKRVDCLHLRSGTILSTEFSGQMRVQIRMFGSGREFCRRAAGNHYVVFPGRHGGAWKLWAQWSGTSLDEGDLVGERPVER